MEINLSYVVDNYSSDIVSFAKREIPQISYMHFVEDDKYFFSYILDDEPFEPVYVPIFKSDNIEFNCSSRYDDKDIVAIVNYPFEFIKHINKLGLDEDTLFFRKKADKPLIYSDFKRSFDDYLTLLSLGELRKLLLNSADKRLVEVLHSFGNTLEDYINNIKLKDRVVKKQGRFLLFIYPSKNEDNLAYGVERFKMIVSPIDIFSKILFVNNETKEFVNNLANRRITPLSYLLLFYNLFDGLRKVDTYGGGSFYLLDGYDVAGLILPPFKEYFIRDSKYMLFL